MPHHTYDANRPPDRHHVHVWRQQLQATPTTYDTTTGQVDTVTYPSGSPRIYIYTSRRLSRQIKDNASGTVLFTAQARDADLHLTQIAGRQRRDDDQHLWDPQTGLLRSCPRRPRATTSRTSTTATTVWATSPIVPTAIPGSYERFCYDPLNRLTKAALALAADPGTSCTTPGGTVKSVAYDAIGNITSKTGDRDLFL